MKQYPLNIILLLMAIAQAQVFGQSLVIQQVKVVDVEAGVLMEGTHDLWIESGRIKVLGSSGLFDYPGDIPWVDGRGKYLIPGLWDMHAHPDDPEMWRMEVVPQHRDLLMPQFVLNGVTGIRDMAGSMEVIQAWRTKGEQGELWVPQIVACGPLLDGPNPMWEGSVGISTPDQVPRIVDSLIQSGADFLKVYSLLPRAIYFALAEYANGLNVPFVGHVPFTVLPSEAARTGMKSQEHLLEILKECADPPNPDSLELLTGIDRYIYRQRHLLNTFDTTRWQTLIEAFETHDIWHTPTLSMWYKNAWYESERPQDEGLIALLPPYMQQYWTVEQNDHLRNRDDKAFIAMKKTLYEQYKKWVRDLHQGGVKLLAGTDVGANPLCFPGVGLHNELVQLVEAGLSPSDALKTATIYPAIFLEIEDEYGSISQGKVADLVLLDANPLQDIEHIRDIYAVIQKGQLIAPSDREKMLAEIRQAFAN